MAVKQVFNTSAELDFPNVLPTLDLDFANSKTLDPRITFTRSSGGSYVGADGLIKYAGVNEARFDHDPVTGESLGLLVEESRTNLLLRSEEFDNSYWAKERTSISQNQITAPDGTLTADTIVEDTSVNNLHRIWRGITFSTASSYTFSVFVKAKERTSVDIRGFNPTDGNQFLVRFNLIDGSVINTNTQSFGIIKYPNGWYRFYGVGTFGARFTQFFVGPTIGAVSEYTGDGTSGIYIWGAQLEQGSFPTSYMPTQASTRTRVGDIAFINLPPTGEWYNYSEGSLVFQHTNVPFSSATSAGFPAIGFAGENGSSTNSIQYYFVKSTGLTQYLVRDLGVNQAVISVDLGAFASKIGFSYKTRSFVLIRNGRLVSRNNSGLVPQSVRTLILGTNVNNPVNNMNASISNLKYFPKALSPSNLQSLTS
jgi:hypothetical protein